MKNNTYVKTSPYVIYADILKILASLSVVFIHVVSTLWYTLDPHLKSWAYLNFADTISRWCVPAFIMVSGLLLLNPKKEISFKNLFFKYIAKIFILLLFWIIFYAFINIWYVNDFSIKLFFNYIVNSQYHLWYLYILLGLYIITPILKKIIKEENKFIIEYFLVLWFIYNFLNYISQLPNFSNLSIIFSKFDFNFITGYIGYYILGYYLHTYSIKKIYRIILYILGLLSIIGIYFSTKFFIINYPNLKRNFI